MKSGHREHSEGYILCFRCWSVEQMGLDVMLMFSRWSFFLPLSKFQFCCTSIIINKISFYLQTSTLCYVQTMWCDYQCSTCQTCTCFCTPWLASCPMSSHQCNLASWISLLCKTLFRVPENKEVRDCCWGCTDSVSSSHASVVAAAQSYIMCKGRRMGNFELSLVMQMHVLKQFLVLNICLPYVHVVQWFQIYALFLAWD